MRAGCWGTISNSKFIGCSANSGGAITLYGEGENMELYITDSEFTGNFATGSHGGIVFCL